MFLFCSQGEVGIIYLTNQSLLKGVAGRLDNRR
jgi:hypothetical protein